MLIAKRIFKRNTHNKLFKALAGFGRALNRLYENRNYDLYSNGELTILKKISKLNPSVIIDGGANIGTYSLLINRLMPKVLIYSFEPVKTTFEKLRKNVDNTENIIPVKNGLYKNNCTKEINLFTSSSHSSLVDIQGLSYESNEKQTIELIRGDDFMKKNKISEIDLLKLDVEGAEFDAILGFEEHIEKGKIKMIQFEYGYINISTKKLLIDFYNYFESKGYIVGKVFPKTVEFRKYEFKYEDFLGPNFIAVKKTEKELIDLLISK
ncbi:MAG: FkbM family methyltransferase [Candidatus Cyclobacteriaceae bacterium M2_1C_046]